jgi:hypothetical protein
LILILGGSMPPTDRRLRQLPQEPVPHVGAAEGCDLLIFSRASKTEQMWSN